MGHLSVVCRIDMEPVETMQNPAELVHGGRHSLYALKVECELALKLVRCVKLVMELRPGVTIETGVACIKPGEEASPDDLGLPWRCWDFLPAVKRVMKG